MSKQFHITSTRLLGAGLAVALLAGIRLSERWRTRQDEASEQTINVPSEEFARAIEVAREYVNEHASTPVDARYTAKETRDGYRVFVHGGSLVLEIS